MQPIPSDLILGCDRRHRWTEAYISFPNICSPNPDPCRCNGSPCRAPCRRCDDYRPEAARAPRRLSSARRRGLKAVLREIVCTIVGGPLAQLEVCAICRRSDLITSSHGKHHVPSIDRLNFAHAYRILTVSAGVEFRIASSPADSNRSADITRCTLELRQSLWR